MASANQKDFQITSENIFYNRLSELETARLQCSQSEWNSYSKKTANGAENQKIVIAKMNEVIPVLRRMQKDLNALGAQVSVLEAKLPKKSDTAGLVLSAREKTDLATKSAPLLKEYEERKAEMTALQALYKMKSSEIPDADNSVVNSFIIDHMGGYSNSKFIPVTSDSFEKLTTQMNANFDVSIKEYAKDKTGSVDLSTDQKTYLALEPTLIAQLVRENPSQVLTIQNFQCQAKTRDQGKKRVETTATIASIAFPIGALGLAKAASSTFVLRSPILASRLATASKVLGFASVALGGLQAANQVANNCGGTPTKNKVEGSCTKNPKILTEQFSFASCLFDATLAALPLIAKGTALAARLGDKKAPLSVLIEDLSKGKATAKALLSPSEIDSLAQDVLGIAKIRDPNLRKAIIDKVSVLDDASRFELGKKLLGEKRVAEIDEDKLKALIDEVHAIPTTPKTLKAKSRLLEEGGLTNEEREIFMRGSVTGKPVASVPIDYAGQIDRAEGANKSRLAAEFELTKANPNMNVVTSEYKTAMDGYAAKVANSPNPTGIELRNASSVASRYGSITTDAQEIKKAETIVGSSYEKLLSSVTNAERGAGNRFDPAEYAQAELQQKLANAAKSGPSRAATEFEVKAIKKYLNETKKWNLK